MSSARRDSKDSLTNPSNIDQSWHGMEKKIAIRMEQAETIIAVTQMQITGSAPMSHSWRGDAGMRAPESDRQKGCNVVLRSVSVVLL